MSFDKSSISQLECIFIFIYIFFSHTFNLQLLDKPWTQVSSLLPPGFCLQFSSRIGFSNPLLLDFSSTVANSRFRAFRKSICAQEKIPTSLHEYVLGGARTHETDLCQARGLPDTPPGRPANVIRSRPSSANLINYQPPLPSN